MVQSIRLGNRRQATCCTPRSRSSETKHSQADAWERESVSPRSIHGLVPVPASISVAAGRDFLAFGEHVETGCENSLLLFVQFLKRLGTNADLRFLVAAEPRPGGNEVPQNDVFLKPHQAVDFSGQRRLS